MAEKPKPDKWARLKEWIRKRHDYFESQYLEQNLSADAADLGAYRAVYGVMKDLEAQESVTKPQNPLQQAAASRPSPA